jgi:hypothetical protein
MMLEFAPWAAYKTASYLLSRQELTDHRGDDALIPSSYSLYGPFADAQKRRAGAEREEL